MRNFDQASGLVGLAFGLAFIFGPPRISYVGAHKRSRGKKQMDGSGGRNGVGVAVVVVVDYDFVHFATLDWVDSSIPDFAARCIVDYMAFCTRP